MAFYYRHAEMTIRRGQKMFYIFLFTYDIGAFFPIFVVYIRDVRLCLSTGIIDFRWVG
jgi:hypothetical protein